LRAHAHACGDRIIAQFSSIGSLGELYL
jgi:hypothetical protein